MPIRNCEDRPVELYEEAGLGSPPRCLPNPGRLPGRCRADRIDRRGTRRGLLRHRGVRQSRVQDQARASVDRCVQFVTLGERRWSRRFQPTSEVRHRSVRRRRLRPGACGPSSLIRGADGGHPPEMARAAAVFIMSSSCRDRLLATIITCEGLGRHRALPFAASPKPPRRDNLAVTTS